MERLRACAEEAQHHLNIAVVELLESCAEAAELLLCGMPYLEAAIQSPGDVLDTAAAVALEIIYSAEELLPETSRIKTKQLRNCVHDLILLSCCRHTDPHAKADFIKAVNSAFCRDVEQDTQLYSRLWNGYRRLFGGPARTGRDALRE